VYLNQRLLGNALFHQFIKHYHEIFKEHLQFSTIACLVAVYKIFTQLRNSTDKSITVDQLLSARVFAIKQ
jgi:hypothetical protein